MTPVGEREETGTNDRKQLQLPTWLYNLEKLQNSCTILSQEVIALSDTERKHDLKMKKKKKQIQIKFTTVSWIWRSMEINSARQIFAGLRMPHWEKQNCGEACISRWLLQVALAYDSWVQRKETFFSSGRRKSQSGLWMLGAGQRVAFIIGLQI